MTTQHAKSNAREGDGVADALHKMNSALCAFGMRWSLDGDYLRCASCKRPHIASAIDLPFRHTTECKLPDSAYPWRELLRILQPIAAMQAQQGAEPVAHRWLRDGEPQGKWVDGMPSERQFQSAKVCADIATWTVEYTCAPATGAPR